MVWARGFRREPLRATVPAVDWLIETALIVAPPLAVLAGCVFLLNLFDREHHGEDRPEPTWEDQQW